MDISTFPPYFWQIGGIFAIALGADLVLRLVFRIMRNGEGSWANAMERSIRMPLLFLIWGFAIIFSIEISPIDLPWAHVIRKVFVIVVGAWALLNLIELTEKFFWEQAIGERKEAYDKTLVLTVSRLMTFAIFFIAILMVLDAFGVPLTAVLAFGGLGGIAISWAAKDVIANFFGGFMIFVNRPFTEGDWIRSPNKNFDGVVEQIGWYMTRIRTPERRPTYIPNALITDAIIENPGRMYHRRIKETLAIRYEDFKKIPEIVDAIRDLLRTHPDIDKLQNILVHLTTFGDSAILVDVSCFTKKIPLTSFLETQQDVLLKIADVIYRHGAEMAFPSQTVYIQKDGE